MQSINKTGSNFTTKLLKNKLLLKGLNKISEHSTSFSAGTSLLLSSTLRPIAIFTTPDVEKENKQYAAVNSICSGLIKFGLVASISIPIEYAIKNIDNNPNKFLNNKTIQNLSSNYKVMGESRSYKLITQILKLGTGFLTAVPKSMLTIALIPILMDKLFPNKAEKKLKKTIQTQDKNVNFTGKITNNLSKGISKIINLDFIQNLAKKYAHKDEDIAKHITAGTDILLTASFAYQTNKSSKIKENRKKALIYNNVLSTGITLFGGYGIDKLIKSKSTKFIEKFKRINAADPKLNKYIEGINILRPALIFAGIYYGLLPIFSTYMAEKIDKFIAKQSKK